MIRCCSKFFIPLPSNSGGPICLSRIYVASSSRDFNQKRYASGENQPPRRFRKFFYTTVGLTLVGVGGVVVYAKSDPKFRKVLDSYVPGSDKFISIVYQEEGINIDFTEQLSTIQDKVLSIPGEIYKQISGESSDESASVLQKKKEFKLEDVAKPKPKPAVDTSKKAIAVFEVSGSEIKSLGEEALKSYNYIISLVTDKANEIIELVDKLCDSPDAKVWKEVRAQFEETYKNDLEVDNKIKEAGEKFKKFSNSLKSAKVLPDDDLQSLKNLESKLIKTKEEADYLIQNKLAASKNYFTKIEEAKERFSDELKALFPNYRRGDTRVKLTEDEIDIFLYYTHQKLLYYQKEIKKLETIIHQKVKKAIDSRNDSQLLEAAISEKVDEAKRKIKEDFDKKMLELKQGCDKDVHEALKRQEQVHLDLLNDQLALKEKEVERKLIQRMEAKVLEEQGRLQAELADMTGRMQGLNEAIAKRALQDQKAQTSQALWSAAEALYDSLKHSNSKEQITPLSDTVEAVKNASAKGDDLVETVLATIPSVAVKRGVYPEDALRERFLKVEEVAWRVAGVPDSGSSLPMLFVAWLQSILVIKASEPIPAGELNNEPFDPSSLNNYDLLQRSRYYVDRGDFEQALKYMNLLKGGARAVSSDWMKEATVLLETQQAANLLLAHASASGMIYS